MTVDDLIAAIAEMMPGASTTPEAMNRWAPVYFRVLKDHEGHKLRAAWDRLLEGWIYQRAPRPAEILDAIEHLPRAAGGKRNLKHLNAAQIEDKIQFWRKYCETRADPRSRTHATLQELEDELDSRNVML